MFLNFWWTTWTYHYSIPYIMLVMEPQFKSMETDGDVRCIFTYLYICTLNVNIARNSKTPCLVTEWGDVSYTHKWPLFFHAFFTSSEVTKRQNLIFCLYGKRRLHTCTETGKWWRCFAKKSQYVSASWVQKSITGNVESVMITRWFVYLRHQELCVFMSHLVPCSEPPGIQPVRKYLNEIWTFSKNIFSPCLFVVLR